MSYPVHPDAIPPVSLGERKYRVTFAKTPEELASVQRLRFEIFNLELGEGLEESYETGLDQDKFDETCHHMIVTHVPTNVVIGTYRMQTSAMAASGGFYSADEFSFDELPSEVLGDAVEIGRACVAKEHRNRNVLFLLWKGLASYIVHNNKRYLFGCCSLTSQDPVEGKRVMEHLRAKGHVHPELRVHPRPGWACYPPDFQLTPEQAGVEVSLPRLFSLYLRYQSKVCGEPALDRFFKTIDYFVLFDLEDLEPDNRRLFFD